MSKRLIQEDERWPAFVRRYASDLGAFAREVCGIKVDSQLARVYGLVEKPGCRVSIASDVNPLEHGTISPMAPIALWNLLCRPDSMTMVAIPFGDVLRCCQQYGELVKGIEGPAAWVREYLTTTMTNIYLDCRFSGGQIRFAAASESHPETFAGVAHGPGLLWLMESAHEIPHDCFGVAGGTLTDQNSRMVLLANSKAVGGWYVNATRNELSKRRGGYWDAVSVFLEPGKQSAKVLSWHQ